MADTSTSLPLVSIIVPVYNGEKYLRESLDSILAQTYPHTEVLVMDDASTDGTAAVLESYRDRVRVIRQPQNRGQFGNVNDGIALALGKYIAVYHADDVYMPTIVEREVEFLEKYPEAGAVFAKIIFIDPGGREFGRLTLPPELRRSRPFSFPVIFNGLLKYKNHFLMCPTAMVRASVYGDVGVYRQDLRTSGDLEMWVRIARKYPVGILDEYLVRYRHFHASESTRYEHLRTEVHDHFQIMDLYLKDGGRAVTTAADLAAHEAHRAEDWLMVVVNDYILGRRQEARVALRQVRGTRLLGSRRVERGRLLVLFLMLQILVRLPRIPSVADLFFRRWHSKIPRIGRPPNE